jgi:hypothetical protein
MLELISTDLAQRPTRTPWPRPDRGCPVKHGWWAPFTLHYKEEVGARARTMRFNGSRHSLFLTLLIEGVLKRREVPPTTSLPPHPQPSLPMRSLHQRSRWRSPNLTGTSPYSLSPLLLWFCAPLGRTTVSFQNERSIPTDLHLDRSKESNT